MTSNTTTKNKRKILVVDDEKSILHALSLFLEQEGYLVETATDCDDYLKNRQPIELPDLIILDILLEDSDGREIAKQLKHNSLTKHIPIIMISAHQRASGLSKRAGADAFLAKPFAVKELLSVINRLRPTPRAA